MRICISKNINGMDFTLINPIAVILLVILIDYSSFINGYEFQCLACDNYIDGPGCGEFTRHIPLRTCKTYCYFAILYNRSSSLSKHSSNVLIRAIRDCSPYDDMTIEGNELLGSKIDSSSSPYVDIITLKRCNSEQCNNDFYLRSDQFLSSSSPLFKQRNFSVWFFSVLIIFY